MTKNMGMWPLYKHPPCKDDHSQMTTVPWKALSGQVWIRCYCL